MRRRIRRERYKLFTEIWLHYHGILSSQGSDSLLLSYVKSRVIRVCNRQCRCLYLTKSGSSSCRWSCISPASRHQNHHFYHDHFSNKIRNFTETQSSSPNNIINWTFVLWYHFHTVSLPSFSHPHLTEFLLSSIVYPSLSLPIPGRVLPRQRQCLHLPICGRHNSTWNWIDQ